MTSTLYGTSYGLATATNAGMVSTTTQTFAGDKTFTGNVKAPIFYGPGNGNTVLSNSTSDGDDSYRTFLCGGGTFNETRGAYIGIQGNDYGGASAGGNIIYVAGYGATDTEKCHIFYGSTGGVSQVEVASTTGAGAWTLGVSGSEQHQRVNGRAFRVNGAIAIGSDGTGYPVISYGAIPTSTLRQFTKIGDYSSIMYLGAGPTDGSNAFEFHSDNVTTGATVTTSASTFVGSVTRTGAWTLGAATTSGTHLIQANNTNVDPVLVLKNVASTVSGDERLLYCQFSGDSSLVAGASYAIFADADEVCGSIVVAATINQVTYATSSDARLKSEFSDFNALDIIREGKPGKYTWLRSGQEDIGFSSQQMHKVFPQAVVVGGEGDDKNRWGMDYGRVTPVLWKAIQEQQSLIAAQATQLSELTALLKAKGVI